MAGPWTTGPNHLYVGYGTANTAAYLGCFERGCRSSFNPDFTPTMSDVAGGKPHDHIYGGTDATIGGLLTVANWSVLTAVMSRPVAGANFGYDPPGARGSLMVTEGLAYIVWVQFPYAAKAAYGGFMPAGYRFPTAWLYGPDELETGTQPNKVGLAFYAQGKQQANGGWLLCDSNFNGIPLVPPATTT